MRTALRHPSRRFTPLHATLLATFLAASILQAQGAVTSPKQQFGFAIGDDYHLANYTQLVEYFTKLDRESDRMTLTRIGTSAEGRPMFMAIITAPENHQKLDRYKEISRRLALAEGLSDDQARALANEGKAVVWIDGGLHATEVLGAQQLIETVYQLVSGTDEETMRFLRDDIVLATLVNPDGMELVSNWYMRNPEPTKRSTGGVPRLYQKYIGHDNNRDFYASTQPETEAVNRIFYLEWFPQIVYNHHQTGPAGTVMFAPPFRDPFNYRFDPLVPVGIDLVGAAMHNRFISEGKAGVTMRSGASYSTWWNGGLRTTVYFHNMIGLLTETIGNPTPIEIPLVPQNQLPRNDLPSPIAPQKWHFKQSVDYSLTANRAVLDVASRHREQLLYNIYQMGRNSIQRGNTDSWTTYPRRIETMIAAVAKDRAATSRADGRVSGAVTPFGRGVPSKYFDMLRAPELRDARGYIISSDQHDFPTATKFVNALMETGITVHRATAPFAVAGKNYASGSYVVKSAQPFRPHVLDMFEPQDHPDDFRYVGGPPTPPYDNAGWTLAYQMDVEFDRILEGFDGPFEKITGVAKPMPGTLAASRGAGWLLSHEANDAFIVVNRLLKNGGEVQQLRSPFSANGKSYDAGTFFIPAKSASRPMLEKMTTELGLSFDAAPARPTGEMTRVRPVRVALWDRYGGSMPSGWVRWILEQFEFPHEVVYAPTLDAGKLGAKYDVIVLVDGAVPERDVATGANPFDGMPKPEDIPADLRGRLGGVTVAKTVPQLRQFLEAGGTVITIGSSVNLGYHLGLPMNNALVEKGSEATAAGVAGAAGVARAAGAAGVGGATRPLPTSKYYIPGSLLEVRVDTSLAVARGIDARTDVMFDNSPVFRLEPNAADRGLRPIAWFDTATPLRSGWAWGQKYLENGVTMAEADVGKGKLYLFGPEITFRAQPHGTFKFLFNGIYSAAARPRS